LHSNWGYHLYKFSETTFNLHITFIIVLLILSTNEIFTQKSTRIIVFGDTRDSGENGINDEILAEIRDAVQAEFPDIILLPGDLIHGGSDVDKIKTELTTWLDTMRSLYLNPAISLLPCRGNHEVDKNNLSESKTSWDEVFAGEYSLPHNGPTTEKNITYHFRSGNTLCIGLDQYPGDPFHIINQVWLDSLLFMNDTQHKFIFGHEPAFNVGTYPNGLWSNPLERNIFWNTLEANFVKVYFAGHVHLFDHARIVNADGNLNNDSHQYIVGTGGAPLHGGYRGYNENNGFWNPDSVFRDELVYGYLILDIVNDQVSITWKHKNQSGQYVPGGDFLSYSKPLRQENFTSYNDFAWQSSQTRNNIQIATSPNTISASSGLANVCEMMDFSTGNPTGVKMRVIGGSYDGNVHAIQGKEPLPGTDADSVFNGKVNCLGTISYINDPNSNLIIQLRGLKDYYQNKCYDVIFYSDRDDYGWERASLVTLKGADEFQNLSSIGIDNISQPLFSEEADSSTRLPADNDSGYVAHFKFDPGTDGEIELEISYDGSTSYKGKYANAIMLKENNYLFPFKSGLLNCTIFIEGAYDEVNDIMRTTIKDEAKIPYEQPFIGLPWSYPGTESVSMIPENVVDWILVELRNNIDTSIVEDSRAGFLLKDGKIVDLDGTSPLHFKVNGDTYYIVVKHRNHLSVMSASDVALTVE